MNDNELVMALRESVADVHTATPVEQIVHRGRTVRLRRRIPGVAGAMAVAAAAVMAVTTLTPSGHPASHQPTVQLAAWTVAMQTDGTINVTIRELRDPARLQSTLRADGLPVNVNFSGPPINGGQRPVSPHPSGSVCQPYPQTVSLVSSIAQIHPRSQGAILVIHPSALPSGAGLSIYERPSLPSQGKAPFPLAVGLVQASHQCTGS